MYPLIAKRCPPLKDLYRGVAKEISSRISSGRILDVGTDPGYLPLEIARRSANLEIIGIDISPAMVKVARRNAESMGLSEHVKFQIVNAANLPFENRYFDLVISTLSLHHWFRPAECIKEIHRVLHENGEAWIYDVKRDTTREANAQVRRRYGRFLSFLFLNIVRAHSFLTLGEVEAILSSPEIGFSGKVVDGQGVILKLRLSK